MKCDFFRDTIDALLDNELSPAMAEEMWRHAKECQECAALLDAAQDMRSDLRELGNRLPPVDFTRVMMKAVREEARKDGRKAARGGRKLSWKGVTGIAAAAAVLLLCIPLFGGMMAGAGSSANQMARAEAPMAAQATSAPAAVYDMAYDMAMEKEEDAYMLHSAADSGVAERSMAMGAAMPESEPLMDGGWGGESGVIAPEPQPVEPNAGNNTHGLKIIRTGDMSLETNSFDRDFQAISDMIAHYEGYTESMSSSGNSLYVDPAYRSGRWGSITARIPSQALDAFMREVGGIGNVTNQSTYSEDVTARYSDTELQLTTLYAQHERLLELVRKAEEVGDLIALEQELQSVQYKIDSLTGNLRGWDARVDYSTVYIYLNEVRAFTGTEDDSLPESMRKALESSIESVRELGRNIVIGAAAAVPYIGIVVALAVVALIVVLVIRATRASGGKLS